MWYVICRHVDIIRDVGMPFRFCPISRGVMNRELYSQVQAKQHYLDSAVYALCLLPLCVFQRRVKEEQQQKHGMQSQIL